MEHIPAPDFPTGAILMGRAGIKRAYRTGEAITSCAQSAK